MGFQTFTWVKKNPLGNTIFKYQSEVLCGGVVTNIGYSKEHKMKKTAVQHETITKITQ